MNSIQRSALFGFCLLLTGQVARAQTDQSAAATSTPVAPTLEAVLVTGEQPGPGLWKVSKDDHVLWILGMQAPLPRQMNWRAQEVEKTIAQSQEVLADASVKVDISIFRMITLWPSLIGAKKNADGAKLQDVLPADLYTRWLTLKARYIGRDNGVERLRPMLAANELYKKAIGNSGLTNKNSIWPVIEAAAKKNQVPVTTVEVKIAVEDPKQAIKDFKSTTGELDAKCLATTITRLETDLDAMRQRANAWAVGDLQALHNLPYPDQRAACLAAVAANPRLAEQMNDAQKQIDIQWLAAAEKSLAKNASTFAVLPINELLKPNGRLEQLKSRGYSVEDPQ
jgi:uncharacterized protein YbaP (TraB family)